MTQEETDYAVISNLIDILCVMCAANRDDVIDLLAGHLWDEEEAGAIKASDGKHNIEREMDKAMEKARREIR